MIPVKLEIEGLYSYKEKQTIDFTQLTSAGLFGIFGAVGSGKSSILEAILLALYGNTERLSARGEKSSMVNLQSEKIAIGFEFLAGKNNQTRYRSQYIAKRNRKNFDDVRPAEHIFYQGNNGSWEPLEEKGEDILGMKMDHFRQTVIIPQGKFRDFIELGPKDRASMMRDLFGLERFELGMQTRNLLGEVKERKIKLLTQLEGLSEFNKELLQEQVSQLKSLKEKESIATNQCTEIDSQFGKAQMVREKFQEFKALQIKRDELQKQLPAVESSKSDLQQYQKANLHFKPILTQLDEMDKDLEKYRVSVTDCSRWKTDYEQEVEALMQTEASLQKEFAKKGEREAKIRDLKKVIEINALQLASENNRKLVENLTPSIQQCQEQINRLTSQIEEQEKELDLIKAPDPNELADLKSTLRELSDLKIQSTQAEKDLQQAKSQLAETKEQASQLKGQMPEEAQSMEDWISLEENKLVGLQSERDKLIQRQGLAAYAQHLHDGEPCPLCGAEEHPDPIGEDFDPSALQANEKSSQEAKKALEEIRKKASELERLTFAVKDLDGKVKEREIIQKSLQERNATLLDQLNNKGFANIEEVEKTLQEATSITARQQKLFQTLKSLRQDCGKLRDSSKTDEETLQKAQTEYTRQLSTIASKKDDLQFKDFCAEYFTRSNDQIQGAIDRVQQAIDDLEVKIKRNKDALIDSRGKQSTNLANLKQFTELLADCESRQSKLRENLRTKMVEMGFELEKDLKAILDRKLNVDQLEAQIREFERQWEITQDNLESMQQNEAVMQFEEQAFQQLKNELEEAKMVLEQVKNQLTLTQSQMENTQQKLEEKAILNKSLEAVEKRESNLRELDGLFKGSGFVKYVSSIYLKDLSHSANLRFMKLTKNNLSLEIDSDNTFWVRDHLNGGKKRLLKTLSGGQTFQASLCLALALAEKVKSLNRSDQSFFFLDEGFGSLDKNSLRVVFETLKSLRHENRVVGIISHVEELQQEIGVYAEVELDGEKGSVVRYSY